MSGAPFGSVVIPAHNEAAVIRRCLDTLFDGLGPHPVQVVVACNGCSDDTAAIARSTGHEVQVLEIVDPSKTGAIRAAEEMVTAFPRIYLDADVELTGAAARTVLDVLSIGDALAARPPIRYETGRSSAVVRSYYRARSRSPELMERLWGAGVYGLSAEGRSRFGPYPEVVAEDLFVDQHFARDEISVVDATPVTVRVPRTLRVLLKVLSRTYRGNATNQSDLDIDGGHRAPRTSTGRVLWQIVRTGATGPRAALDAATYVCVTIAGRMGARFGRRTRWERDDSSREA